MTTFALAGAPHVLVDEKATVNAAMAVADTLRALARGLGLSPEQCCVAGMLALSEIAAEADGPTRSWMATCATLFDAEEAKAE